MGSYEWNPSGKSIRSASLGHESESTEGGSDLLYCLIKINLVCPMLEVEEWNEQWEIVEHVPPSPCYTDWGQSEGCMTRRDSWHVGKRNRKGHQMCPVMQNIQKWLKDYEMTIFFFWHGPVMITPIWKRITPHIARCMQNQIPPNPIPCFNSFPTAL